MTKIHLETRGSALRDGSPKVGGFRKPKQERWTELLQVAAEVFFEKGYDATSLQEIADRTGILKGSIYYYIKTKGDLLAHLLRDAHQAGMKNIGPIAYGTGAPLTRLAGMIRAHIQYVCSARALTAVFVRERNRLTPEQRREYLGDEHSYRRLFEKVIAEAQVEKMIREDIDEKLASLCLLGSLNSLYQWYRPDGGFSVEKIADHYIAESLVGIMVPSVKQDFTVVSTRKPSRSGGSPPSKQKGRLNSR